VGAGISYTSNYLVVVIDFGLIVSSNLVPNTPDKKIKEMDLPFLSRSAVYISLVVRVIQTGREVATDIQLAYTLINLYAIIVVMMYPC
jgi:hypothetical protein